MKYAWIEQMAGRRLWWFSVQLACELLEVARSGFYDWRARQQRPATPRQREQQLLLAAITVEHIASRRRYGSPRIHAELVEQGWQIGVNRVARLMALHGIEGRSGRLRRHNLTRQAKVAPDIPDLLQRDFSAAQPNTRWTTDITYVPTAEGWVYLFVACNYTLGVQARAGQGSRVWETVQEEAAVAHRGVGGEVACRWPVRARGHLAADVGCKPVNQTPHRVHRVGPTNRQLHQSSLTPPG